MILHFFIFPFLIHAGGLIQIDGTLKKPCEIFLCQIKVGTQVYKIDLTRLSNEQQILLKGKKINDPFKNSIPMSAIKEVIDIK